MAVMGLFKVIAGVAAFGAFFQSFGGKKDPKAPDPKKPPKVEDDGKLGPYIYVKRQFGAADGPVLILLHDNGSTAEAALELLDGLETSARVFALVGDQFAAGGHAFVDVLAADQTQAELDAGVKLSAAMADALFKYSPKRRVVVAGVGASGTLAAVCALFGGVAVRVGLGAGGGITVKQLPKVAGADAPAKLLTWGAELAPSIAAAKLAGERGLKVEIVELDGDPELATLGAWLRQELAKALP